MKDRLILFMQAEQLTASRLAEIIDVQPSAISHIIAERNRPSYEFLYKLFSSFPRLNPTWFILGSGEMYHEQYKSLKKIDNVNTIREIESQSTRGSIKESGRQIEKIIIFYDDNTFDSYKKE